MTFDHNEYEELIEMVAELKKLIVISKICFSNSLNEKEIDLIIGPSRCFIDWIQRKIDSYEQKLREQEASSNDY